MTIESNALTRFAKGTKHTGRRPLELKKDNAAVVEGRTMFPTQVRTVSDSVALLKSGHNSSKVGKFVTKGRWKGFPIYTLSLEERKTCPRSCQEWRICYGNHMPYAHRYEHGPKLENKLTKELYALQRKHKNFVVRLHVLGDFYSVAYVDFWSYMLMLCPGLHIFGYTARKSDVPIGTSILSARRRHGERFSIRFSGVEAKTIAGPLLKPEGIVCPAQTGQSLCCGTCTLCWSAPTKTILFMAH